MYRKLIERPWRARPPSAPFAWRPPGRSTRPDWIRVEDWHQRIGAWQALLEQHAAMTTTWLLFEPDPLEFSAALVAIWERGDSVLLPADNQPETVGALHRAGVALGQVPGAASAGAGRPPRWSSQPLPEIALSLYTSGSTGEPQRLDKSFAQLDAELATQASLWPFEGRVVISQVSHQHIYGLLFAILRPLCEGAPIAATTCRYPETLLAWLACCRDDARQAVLVSAPPALSRLPETLDWQPVHPALARIYSSGAPLSRAASDLAQACLGTPVHEVYGSSETGGIAWRIQQRGEAWTPFPGIEVRNDDEQRLWLRSPHLATPEIWQRQADRIRFAGDGFVLLGRADRIVKIGGKRISLTAVDRALNALLGVERAQALPLQRRDLRLAAVVQLSETELPRDHAARRDAVRRLRQQLAARFETPALPRYWRFVDHWPTNAQGKLSADIRQRLFQDLDDRRAPRWLGERPVDGGWCITLEVPEQSAYVDGHFDAQPVLPGVTLVHWAMQLARRLFSLEAHFAGLERLRFPLPLLPGDRFEMTLVHTPAHRRDAARQTSRHDSPRSEDPRKESLQLHCDSRRGRHVSGRIALTEENADVE